MTCPHGEPAPSCCVDCLEAPPPPQAAPKWAPVGDVFPARHPGTCRDCGRAVDPGDPIQRWDRDRDPLTVYVHPECKP